MPEQKPSPGRIVHYVLSQNDPISPHLVGQHRPAMIVRTWDENAEAVQLQVFMDGANDWSGGPLMWVPSCHQGADNTQERSWHWPEYVG